MRKYAQDPKSTLGKIVRMKPDGSEASVWTSGHRNVQAMAFDAQGRLWVVEHGTKGGDELNLIERGKNYGWPLVAYGKEYSGDAFPHWRGSLFTGSLKDRKLVRVELKDGKVVGEEHLLGERGQRIRDVRQGPDGALYLVTDENNGQLWKITPKR